MDISKAISTLLAYNEAVFSIRGDFMKIHEWINSGCDMEKDILPALTEMMERNKKITSIAYFGPAVYRRRDNRLELEKASKNKPQTSEEQRANAIAFRVRMNMFINSQDQEFLVMYTSKQKPPQSFNQGGQC